MSSKNGHSPCRFRHAQGGCGRGGARQRPGPPRSRAAARSAPCRRRARRRRGRGRVRVRLAPFFPHRGMPFGRDLAFCVVTPAGDPPDLCSVSRTTTQAVRTAGVPVGLQGFRCRPRQRAERQRRDRACPERTRIPYGYGPVYHSRRCHSFAAIGIRQPVPKVRSVTLMPGGACFRLNSAARTMRSTACTVFGGKPAATISSADS